ncbi:MAG TPA: LytR C-terminal domain-containing protein, partial [Acidimicrobiales bacterium]|nr:LytR C-terminal domain-containing protein [Acidimicrobiales bacterium]
MALGYATALQHAGWTVLTPVTAKPPVHATSVVYYAANKRSEADAVAAALGVLPGAVLPVSPATPVSNIAGADVIVLIGSDLAAKTPPSTVPPTTTTTKPKATTTTKPKATT